MPIYPFGTPIIMNDQIFAKYGGKGTGTFSFDQLQLAYQIAEQETVNFIGTLLLPTIVTGTFITPLTRTQRISTDYGYVSQILGVIIKTQKVSTITGAELLDTTGSGFIYSDTFGYIDVVKLQNTCSLCPNTSSVPYQYQVVYEAGLPTGTANLPSMLAAMTIITSITLNELYPGEVGMNEGTGDIGIQEFESFSYHERRTAHSLVRTAFGGSAKANKAAQLIRSCVKLARRSLKVS